ncbi:MAG TPA: hypothetical protein VGR02_02090 [Thermoanaerobaculia bacterium]|jgi:hypothetical protein|nr:hypothetical protein [Thermoanaerobaculia bacterium]
MSGPAAAPATRFHDVIVINDQTHAEWHARRGRVYEGRIEVAGADGSEPPASFFDNRAHTFTVVAQDGGNRTRRFPSLSVDQGRTFLPTIVVFV